jgi:hypothetical protein
MGKHSAPHTNYDGSPLPLVHFPGPAWQEGALTPCGEPYIKRDMCGQLVTAVPTAIDPRLVNCEACYAKEDIKHRQDYEYGQHSDVSDNVDAWLSGVVARSRVLSHVFGVHPTTPATPVATATEDVRPGNDDQNDRMVRWLASNRFHTPDDLPPPDVQDYLERIHQGHDGLQHLDSDGVHLWWK